MSNEVNSVSKPEADGGGLRQLFLEGLPTMVAIVTAIVQPITQMTCVEGKCRSWEFPDWTPVVVAAVASFLLAFYRVRIVRRAALFECMICVPLLMLMIFCGAAAGNNVVNYSKQGITGELGRLNRKLETLEDERNILEQKLQKTEELVGTLRRAVDLPQASEAKPRSSVPSLLGMLRAFMAGEVYAQEPRAQPGDRRREQLNVQQLQEALKKYEGEQRRLDQELEKIRQEREKGRETPPPQPLFKKW